MKPRMTFLTLLLFFELTLSVTAGFLGGELYARFGMLLALLLPLLLLLRAPAGTPPIRFAVKDRRAWLSLLLLPLFVLLTAGVSFSFSALCRLLGIPLREVTPMASPLLAVLFDALLPALPEELFCRGALFSTLRPMGRRTAVFGSALLFALMHANLAQLPYAFIAGIALGALYEFSGSLLFPILFHLANNLLSLSLYFGLPLPVFFAVLGGAAALTLPLFLLLAKKTKLTLPKRDARRMEGVREFFLSPLLLYIAVILTFTFF